MSVVALWLLTGSAIALCLLVLTGLILVARTPNVYADDDAFKSSQDYVSIPRSKETGL
jgi:hypothetical protein